jgi:hypothetical protein
MLTLRGAGGLGDALYMYPVLKYYLEQGKQVEILTKYPDVYTCLKKQGLIVTDRYAKQPDRECRYAPRYPIQETTTYQDTLILSGIDEYLPFEFEFEKQKPFKFNTDKKICVIRTLTLPMKQRGDEACLIPNGSHFQAIINAYKYKLYFVLAGSKSAYRYKLTGIDLDLTDTLNIKELFQLISQSDICLSQSCFFIPSAEALNKKNFVVFAADGFKCPFKFYKHITPKKVINKKDIIGHAIDDEPKSVVIRKFGELLDRGQSDN